MQLLTGNRPLPGVLFGITHAEDGTPIIKERRVLKVGIGLPKGRGLNVWLHHDKLWYFRIAKKVNGRVEFETCVNPYVAPVQGRPPQQGFTRKEAERFYRENIGKAEMVSYPRKLGYFTFTRPMLQPDGTEIFEPDFDAIEAHGATPTAIDVVFLDDNPFEGAYQMWSASQLLCRGDGVIAERVVELGLKGTPDEQAAAKEAKDKNKRLFPIVNECWTSERCRFSKEFEERGKLQPSPCKPGGDLKFQLANNIRVGGTAYYHTTGFRSISQIFSSLERIKALTGNRVAGIPLKMVLHPYKTRHNGQTATQYGVSLEFRAEDIQSVKKNLIEQAWKFRELAAAPLPSHRYIEAPAVDPATDDDDDENPHSAQAMVDEYYPNAQPPEDYDGVEDDGAGAPPPTASASAEAATNEKTAALAEKLAKKNRKPDPPPTEAAPAPAQSTAPAPVEEERDDAPEDPEDPRFQRKPGDMF